MFKSALRRLLGGFALALSITPSAHAGVLNLPNFVEVGAWGFAVEPQITLTSGAGLSGTGKFTYGLNELSNLQLGVGTGSGPKQFHAGGALTFDFVPDVESQPGLGVALQAYYQKGALLNQVELTAIPYLHKEFDTGAGKVDPFLALPIGFGFEVGQSSNQYTPISLASVGATFRSDEAFRYTIELGIAINNTDSYVSGGVTYRH